MSFFSSSSLRSAGRSAVNGVIQSVLGGRTQPSPYMRTAKKVVSDYFSMPWLHGWQWAVEFTGEGVPDNADIYVKDVSFGAGSIDTDVKVVGSGGIALPTSSSAGEITMTVRDVQNLVMNKWFDERLARVKNQDGTINIPSEYVFEIHLYTIDEEGNKTLYKSYQVYPTKKGDVTWSREDINTVASFPLVFQKFSSVGKKVF